MTLELDELREVASESDRRPFPTELARESHERVFGTGVGEIGGSQIDQVLEATFDPYRSATHAFSMALFFTLLGLVVLAVAATR